MAGLTVGIILRVVTTIVLYLFASCLTAASNDFLALASSSDDTRSSMRAEFILPIHEKTWRITSNLGFVDWSPVDNMFIVGNETYGANGAKLFTFANVSSSDGFGYARFSPSGSKIAYFYLGRHGQPGNSQLFLFDIKTKTTQSVRLASNITDIAWSQDDNTIFYGTNRLSPNGQPTYTHLEIIKYDLKAGAESVALVTTSGYNFDISHDGKSIAYTDRIIVNPKCNDYFGTHPCYNSRLVVMPFDPSNNSTILEPTDFRVIFTGEGVRFPRWTPDDASMIVINTPSTLFAYPCNSIIEVARDGSAKVDLLAYKEIEGCYDSNISYSKDHTMVAYGRRNSGGFPDGTYLGFTELCREGIACTAPLQDLQNQIMNPTIIIGIGAAIAGAVSFLALRKRKK